MYLNFIVWFYQMKTVPNLENLESIISELWQIWFPLSVLVNFMIAYGLAYLVPFKRNTQDIGYRRILFFSWGVLAPFLHYVANHFYHRTLIIDEDLISDWDTYNRNSTAALLLTYFVLGLLISIILKKSGNKFGTIWLGK